jgi:ATP-binding cassette, subfamily F, member 3
LSNAAPRTTNTELRNLLGCFLFSEDDVFKHIGVLSGGERNRYALARMLLHPANFLLLDEPTNHLDLRAKDVLLESLEKFSGTVMFVSHDRYFIENLANRVFEVADGTVHVFPGNYADYLWRKGGGAEETPTIKDVLIGVPPAEPVPLPSKPAPAKRVNPIKLKQMQDEAQQLEDRITQLETEIQNAELALSDYVGADEAMRLSNLLEGHRVQLEETMTRWESVTAELEAIA